MPVSRDLLGCGYCRDPAESHGVYFGSAALCGAQILESGWRKESAISTSGVSDWISTSRPAMDCERQGWRGRNPAICGDKPSGSFRRPSCGGPGSPGAPEATLGVGALPPCAPPPGWRQGTVLPNSCGSPSEGKIVRLLLNPDPQSIQSGAWKLILRNPDVAAGGASEQHVTGAFLFGTQIAWASLTERYWTA
jgi:hypothetical protein